ncbi:hypothetical protein R1T16_03330 [Flavobacterium sp. DG1-102-2]|uniref:hypothetical protein n=1 Tax=Flavobacterium sp. DG1-102-2 TaxID=3081663 RepID=UPI002948FD1D|nr:hypothetical protein [Flavobacterium sp. DG1-102-2]MDV6167442.1 hypothetical protein [Flavobacterium sp. DG1-102-2]
MDFTANDLAFKNSYSWPEGANAPKNSSGRESIKVDKKEGTEVVDFCNQFLASYGKPLTKRNFQLVEKILAMPEFKTTKLRSHLNNSINTNWKRYSLQA